MKTSNRPTTRALQGPVSAGPDFMLYAGARGLSLESPSRRSRSSPFPGSGSPGSRRESA